LDQEKYLHSFLKKRILTAWNEQQPHIHMTTTFPQPFERRAAQNTYNQLKPLLLASYTEDFNQPYSEFSIHSWLQYVKLLAEITGKVRDARQWDELSKFISYCSQFNLVDL
jgi:hypothetical protein